MRPLTNDRWGFESNCFVCEARNEAGLRIPFHHDEERERVVATFTLGPEHSGAPAYAHGGIVLAIADEAMAWAAIAIAGQWAVTSETSARFDRPVLVGREHTVEARVVSQSDEAIRAAAVVTDGTGRRCAAAEATFTPLGEAQAVDATGAVVAQADSGYLRRPNGQDE